MLFNSFAFIVFFLIVYALYLALRSRSRQNLMLLVASYVFYGWWDYRFLSLLIISTIVDYFVGRHLASTTSIVKRKWLLALSMVVNLGMLGFFKYYNFFADSFARVLNINDPLFLEIVLPMGISFYTFQTMSYTIDVYRKKLSPVNNILDFALFVSFFPQLVAGPIERASTLLPQICKPRKISADQVQAAAWLLVWGFFKKIVIADNLGALLVTPIFEHYRDYHGLDILLAALGFTVQIYCDFSGYSDIARGLAKLMGFDLMLNFRLPYFAVSPSDFWRRWHISLSTWLRDYLYIPLGGNRKGSLATYRNLMVTMLLGGLWHGASWNFVIWGAYHGALLAIYRLVDQLRGADAPGGDERSWAFWKYPTTCIRVGGMFVLTVIGWIIFRCKGTAETAVCTGGPTTDSFEQLVHCLTSISLIPSEGSMLLLTRLVVLSLPLIVVQLAQHYTGNLLVVLKTPLPVRGLAIGMVLIAIFLFNISQSMEFIYFQF